MLCGGGVMIRTAIKTAAIKIRIGLNPGLLAQKLSDPCPVSDLD